MSRSNLALEDGESKRGLIVPLFSIAKQANLARGPDGRSPSQVSRDERDEYYGATLEKIQKVFDVLGFKGDVHVSPKEEQGELALV